MSSPSAEFTVRPRDFADDDTLTEWSIDLLEQQYEACPFPSGRAEELLVRYRQRHEEWRNSKADERGELQRKLKALALHLVDELDWCVSQHLMFLQKKKVFD